MIEENKTTKEIDSVENLLRQGKYHEAIVLCEEIHKASSGRRIRLVNAILGVL